MLSMYRLIFHIINEIKKIDQIETTPLWYRRSDFKYNVFDYFF